MKRFSFLLSTLILLSCTSFTESDTLSDTSTDGGIEFYHSFSEGLAKAKETGKPIFLDAYAQWCGPCKWMAAKTFTKETVGEFYNKNFINVKLDAEKGEGLDFSRKYGIRAFPSLFFITPEGKVISKSEGALDEKQILKLGKKILSKYEGG